MFEEIYELKEAVSPEDVMLELADILEIAISISNLTGVNWYEVLDAADKKRKTRGSFNEGVCFDGNILAWKTN